MDRAGITRHISEVKDDFLGEITVYRQVCSAYVEKVVKSGKWFSFSKLADKRQVDILSATDSKGVKIGSMVGEFFQDSIYRVANYKYMLHDYMCYYEQPVVKRVNDLNGYGNSYNKFIVTANLNVVSWWMGISVEEASKLYGSRLAGSEVEDGSSFYPYLKLYSTKTGEHKITKPRTNLDLGAAGIRIVPMFALKVGVDTLYEMAKEGTYNINFLKDSGQLRTINTCFSKSISSTYYKNSSVVEDNWSHVYNGDFESNPSLERGYIRVFEMGSSVYNSPTRSINFARIVGLEKAEPDMSYMYIDIDAVLDTFIKYIYKYKWAEGEIEEFVSMLDAFEVGSKREVNKVRMSTVSQLEAWAQSQNILLSTVFIRQLALFMIANPKWFEGYTGEGFSGKKDTLSDDVVVEGTSFTSEVLEGLIPFGCDDDFELPLG